MGLTAQPVSNKNKKGVETKVSVFVGLHAEPRLAGSDVIHYILHRWTSSSLVFVFLVVLVENLPITISGWWW